MAPILVTPRIRQAARAYQAKFGQVCPLHSIPQINEDQVVQTILDAVARGAPIPDDNGPDNDL